MDGADCKTVVRKQLRVSINPKTQEVTKKITRERNTLTPTKNTIVERTLSRIMNCKKIHMVTKAGSLVANSRKE